MHRPAGSYAPGRLLWAPQVRPIRRIPIQFYNQPVLQVPLVGGQAQTVIGGWATATGSVTHPAINGLIAQTAVIPAGTYTVAWSVTLSGTLSGADANNFILNLGAGIFLTTSVNPAVAGTYPQAPYTFSTPGGLRLLIIAGGTLSTAGSVYGGTITGQSGGTVSVGPQGFGNLWNPASLTVQTTSGANDASTCNVYAGPAGVGVTLLGTFLPGTAGAGVASFALPSLSPGQYLIAVWSGGNPGDVATMNVVGTMNSVMPGSG